MFCLSLVLISVLQVRYNYGDRLVNEEENFGIGIEGGRPTIDNQTSDLNTIRQRFILID